ncbi:MAG TPA: potassium-transporting ATPase subunit KdpA [Kofleriaceae bacterium]|jgi:K+-transporting ATPase ATPase A chain|nr:potassium-transporting ATPase subunit KdpA [Kofleriaceae bacterium]
MTFNGWLQILVFFAAVFAITKPVGVYLHRVFEGDRQPLPRTLGRVERGLLRLCGLGDPADRAEQTWVQYAVAMLVFSAIGLVVTYAIQRAQGALPGNPQHFAGVPGPLAWNTAASFTTNTNWQSYVPETTMSYATQMAGLAWHNFTSAAVGIGVALVVARGLTRQPGPGGATGVGNFYVDLIRGVVYVLVPACAVIALVLVSQGVIQNLAAYHQVTTVEGNSQLIAMGPVASQEAIKLLGTNGGGFFNANSAHPFENPSALTNLIELILIFAIPAGLTYTYGRMARDQRQGWVLFAAMSVLFFAGVATAYWAEAHPNAALHDLTVATAPGNLEGKELRFGVANSALFATVTTDASCGAVNSMHDSFTPLGGLVPMVNIELGEVVFGGVGAGLYGILIFVVLAVFIAGLMVGRTPEYLGKKIEGREMKLAMLYILVFPLIILGFTAWAAVASYGNSHVSNAGPHGLSEMLYAFVSGAGNNGSAFAGLDANHDWWNICLGFAMLAGRFFMILPAMAIAGAMLNKKTVPPGPGTFPTNGWLFTALLLGVIVIVGALTFFPALSLGPIVEHFQALHGEVM